MSDDDLKYLIKYLTMDSKSTGNQESSGPHGSQERRGGHHCSNERGGGHNGVHEHEGPDTTVPTSTKGSAACKSAKDPRLHHLGAHRRQGQCLPRQHQYHEVQREEGVEQHEQGLHQGHLWQVKAKVGGLHSGPGQCLQEMNVPGPPTPMYDLCKNNFASAESFSLRIFMP